MQELATNQRRQGIASFLGSESVKANIISVLGKENAQAFISSVVSAVQTNPALAECTKPSILSAALLGYSLKLPQSPQLAMFYMVPYNAKKKDRDGREITQKECQFQLSYRGYLNLAMRSGQYQKINVSAVKEGELKSFNPITEEIEFDTVTDYGKRESLPTVGYYGYFVLNNGFKKEIYWSREKMDAHAKRYSYAYRKGWDSLWKSDFDAMAFKTIIRQLISKWGILSVEMEKGYIGDMAVVREDGEPDYIDNVPDEPEKAVDIYADAVEVDVPDCKEDLGNDGADRADRAELPHA